MNVTELQKNLIERVAVGDILRRRASCTPDQEALLETRAGGDIRLTYRELNARVNQMVHGLRDLGLEQGERVALFGPNSHEYLISLFACAKGGFVAVPINPALPPKDILYILQHAEVSALIVDDALAQAVKGFMGELASIRHYLSIPATNVETGPEFLPFDRVIQGKSGEEIEDVVIQDRDVFEVLYTSGTTARPKGVQVTHLAVFVMSLTNLIEMRIFQEHVGTTLLPLFHCAQQTFTTSFLHVGAKTVIFRGFDPVVMMQAIQREKIGFMFCLPVMYAAILNHPKVRDFDLGSVQRCVYAMTPMDQTTLEKGIKYLDAEFMLGTGQTEFFPSTNTLRSQWQLEKQGNYWGESALTLDTAIMDEAGNILKQGEVGEIVWRGPAVMAGYLKNPEETEKVWQYGWHHSGDLGYFDSDSLLVFVDRKKDMIKTGGENVPSIKVEKHILNDPRVEAVAVVGLPHTKWGEAVTTFVQPVQGQDLTEEDVFQLCEQGLGRFERPKKVVIVDELPKTSTGKMKKHILRDEYVTLYQDDG